MDRHDHDDEVQYVRGVNWAPNFTDEDEDPMAESEVQYVRGVNWAPNSTDEDEDPMAESEMLFVMDTYAGETEVPDSQMDIAEVDDPDAEVDIVEVDELDTVHALQSFASKFQSDKVKHEGCGLMLPVLFPRLYGDHDEDVNGAAVSLLWICRGYSNVSNGLPRIPDEGLDAEAIKEAKMSMKKKTEEVKMSMFKIIFPFINKGCITVSSTYDECIKDCDKAVERGRELRADFKMISRALTRKGTALVKLAKTSKDFDIAIETFQKALTEHRNPDTLKKLNEAERAKKELEQQEYYDPKLADEEREKGNEFFKEQKYPEAIKHYTESLRRNPKDPRVYSNRAASYTKLGAMPEGLKDAEKCLELDPTFTKGYTRKGAIQFFMKEYDKAMETYQAGLKHDPNNQELLDGVRRCIEQINKANRGEISQDELQERQNKAMQDPEIQNILTDPIMRQVLTDFQENPRAAQEHLKNPGVMQKIQKLSVNKQQGQKNEHVGGLIFFPIEL
ncbi:unnamed protein product [Miscanthus lutarioriparius]|uniref:STI1 domain-containing protein n=1 Tax=Miscanthus lutarioriparius TaxID=422564 RepID=A0A811PUQ4_9POAL|nr:unnamed protein product [Miscanthus lutarioriparius]